MKTKKSNKLAIALRGFFCDYLPHQKGTSFHTIHSYRDSIKLLLLFLARDNGSVNALCFEDMNVDNIIAFLNHLESERNNSIGTRNIRLSAAHSFFRYVPGRFPEYFDLSQQILSVPFKRMRTCAVEYLEFEELTAIFNQIDRSKQDGQRDYALLTLMFNTGGRVQEIVDLRANDLHLSVPFSVRLFGKGRKERICPLWTNTASVLRKYVENQGIDLRKPATLFMNHLGTPLTRFGVRYILEKYIHKAALTQPSLRAKRLHPHSIRHYAARRIMPCGLGDTSAFSLENVGINTSTTLRYAA